MRRNLPTENPAPDGFDFDENTPLKVVRREFAKRLQNAMADVGLNQSELARKAASYMPDGAFGRDLISHYVRGIAMPRDSIRLGALAKALGVEPSELIPRRHFPSVETKNAPPLDVQDVGAGKAWLRVNQRVDWNVALEILQLLKGQEDVPEVQADEPQKAKARR